MSVKVRQVELIVNCNTPANGGDTQYKEDLRWSTPIKGSDQSPVAHEQRLELHRLELDSGDRAERQSRYGVPAN